MMDGLTLNEACDVRTQRQCSVRVGDHSSKSRTQSKHVAYRPLSRPGGDQHRQSTDLGADRKINGFSIKVIYPLHLLFKYLNQA